MHLRDTIMPLCLALPLILGCTSAESHPKPQRVGGPCTYQEFAGTATITQILTLQGTLEIHFAFAPNDPEDLKRYRIPHAESDRILHTTDGQPLPADWAKTHALSVGSTLPMTCREIKEGTCTPLIYRSSALPGVHG